MHHNLEFDKKCTSCNGTGIYVGFAEKDGFGVECHSCKGTGCQHIIYEYDDFEGKKKRNDIKIVVKTNPGIGLGINERLTYESFGGMNYNDWFNGQPFPKQSEMRKFSCPAWWYQCADYNKKPNWDECIGCGSFSNCSHFNSKELCWDKFDRENN